jgi:hypothetical protein
VSRRRTRALVAAASLSLVISTATFTSPQAAQAPPSGASTAPVRPTGPPPDAPVPGSRCMGCGVAPEPIDDTDRTGWTQIFDGRTLAGWEGHPEVWTVEDGAITAESWPDRRVGTTFLIWRGSEPANFELKLDIKAGYTIHGGVFYRGIVGPAPARAGGPGGGRGAAADGGRGQAAGPTAAAGAAAGAARGQQAPPAVPADPRWHVRGYSMDWDYDPGNNGNIQDPGAGRTDTQIVWRGHIVRTENGVRPRSIGSLGDRDQLMTYLRLGDWNQLHIIAEGRQLTHIVNGHVMAILIDDDPAALKTKGVIALQIEQFGMGKIHFRNIWLKQ